MNFIFLSEELCKDAVLELDRVANFGDFDKHKINIQKMKNWSLILVKLLFRKRDVFVFNYVYVIHFSYFSKLFFQ